MLRDIEQYVRSCPACLASKTTAHGFKPPLTIRDPAPHAYHTITIDTVGPLPETPEGYKHMVCTVDMATRHICAWPSKDLLATSIAKQVHGNIICVHSCPRRILSDNGTCFTSKFFDALNKIFGISHIFAASYHPMSQGSV